MRGLSIGLRERSRPEKNYDCHNGAHMAFAEVEESGKGFEKLSKWNMSGPFVLHSSSDAESRLVGMLQVYMADNSR